MDIPRRSCAAAARTGHMKYARTIRSCQSRFDDGRYQVYGHADLMEDHNGNWWLVFLAVRPITDEHRRVLLHNLGRETFLAPVTWENGWPVVNGGHEVMMEMDGPLPQEASAPCLGFHR